MEEIVKKIKEVAKKLGIEPAQVTHAQLMKHTDVTNWQLRKYGTLNGIKNAHFPIPEKDLLGITENQETTKLIRKLEKELGESRLLDEKLIKAAESYKPVQKIKNYKSSKSVKLRRELNAVLSDTHYGIRVVPEAVGSVNEYNWQVASRRTGMFVDEVNNYKKDKRHEVEQLNLFIIGDIIGGVIHDTQYRNLDLLIHQQNGALHILTHGIAQLIPNFKKVNVYCLPGNHEDNPLKRGGGRVLTEKFDSFINHTFYALSMIFRNNPSVKFITGQGTYLTHDSLAGRMLLTHGDILFSKELGNPGSSLNVKSLSNAINRFNAGEVQKGLEQIKAVIFGHVHSYSDFITFDGVRVLTNPSLSGVDGFAHSLGINHNLVGQVVFETTPEYIVGDSRLICVHTADKQKKYDKIIPPYNYELITN